MLLFKNNSKKQFLDSLYRVSRATIGAFILLVIITSILIPQVLAVSGKSIVNAKLEWIRTPINGNVTYNNLKPGDTVIKGDVLGNIVNERADDSFLNSLRFEKSSIESELLALNNKLQQLHQKKADLQISVSDALLQLKEQTGIRINTIETELTLTEGKKAETESLIKRYKKVNKGFSTVQPYSVVSREIIDEQRLLLTEINAYISNQKDALKILHADYAAAIRGSFASKNTPPEQQQLKRLEQDFTSVLSAQEALNLKLDNLSKDIDERVEKLNLNRKHEFTSRVTGILWDLGFADGSYVNNGDSLVAIADTDTLTVDCIFHQRYLDNIDIGDFATVDLLGSDQQLKGRVSEVMIRDAVKNSNLRAFSSTSPQTNEFKVTVTLDTARTSAPIIGQRAKVVITKKKTSLVSSLLLFLSH